MEERVAKAFGVVLRTLRKEAGMTQEEVGLEADLQRKYVSLLELGQKAPSLTTVFKLARALRADPGSIVAQVEQELHRLDT